MKKIIISLLIALVGLSACSDSYLDRTPTDAVEIDFILTTPDYAQQYLNGVYKYFLKYAPDAQSQHDNNAMVSRIIYDDCHGLDLVVPTNWYSAQYGQTSSQRVANAARARYNWAWAYQIIKDANVLIDAGEPNESSDGGWTSVLGQAYALRAFGYYQLCNLYQKHYRVAVPANMAGFPLVLDPPSTDPNDAKPRGLLKDVYDQMVIDGKAALTRLTNDSRINPNTGAEFSKSWIDKHVASGILARIYTDMAYVDPTLWNEVITLAQDARQGSSFMSTAQFRAGFSEPNNEWIWGIINDLDGSTGYAAFFSFYDQERTFGYKNFRADSAFVVMFDANDCRGGIRVNATSSTPVVNPDGMFTDNKSAYRYQRYFIRKFRDNATNTGSIPLMRTSEMYLLEAEALANQDDYPGAQLLVDEVRKARALDPSLFVAGTAPATREDMLRTIWIERRKDLFGEGFALKDILRFGNIINAQREWYPANTDRSNHNGGLGIGTDPYMSPAPVDNDYRYIYQIPEREIDNNPKISVADQNQ